MKFPVMRAKGLVGTGMVIGDRAITSKAATNRAATPPG